MKKSRLNENQMRSAIRKWLFEYNTDSGVSHRASTDDKVAGTMGDDRQEQTEEPSPIVATDQMSNQHTRDLPPVDDDAYVPQSPDELAAASDQLGRGIPSGEVEWYYNELKSLRDKAVDRNNKVNINDLDYEEPEIKNPITPKRGTVTEEGVQAQTLISLANSSDEAEFRNSIRKLIVEASFRKKDFARKWKQGDRLDLHRGDDDTIGSTYDGYRQMDDFEVDDEGEELVPTVDDLRDFLDAYPDADLEDAPGWKQAVERHNAGPQKDTTLEDLVKTGIYPDVKAPSGMKGKIDRTILPVVGAIKNAPQLMDRIVSLAQSSWGRMMFYQGMLAAGLITEEEVEDLKKHKDDLMTSEMYKYIVSQSLVQPAMGILRKMEKKGEYDSKNPESQISPEQAEEIIEKLKSRWNGMSKSKKANDARRAMQGNLEFLERDTSVMG